jgi:hypothetical protein
LTSKIDNIMFWCNDFSEDGVNRSDWKMKSEAAVRRQTEAIALFDTFLEEKQHATVFPITEELIPVTTHLTEPCWHTFRKHVESKGCHAKRRLATVSEREREGAKERKGKMYVVSVTVPVHPSQAVAVNEERKHHAEQEAVKRKEKAQALASRKKAEQERLEDIIRERKEARQTEIQTEYEALLAVEDDDRKPPAVIKSESGVTMSAPALVSSAPAPSVLDLLLVKSLEPRTVVTSAAPPPVAALLTLQPRQPIEAPTVSAEELLGHADKVHQDRMKQIHSSIQQEKNAFEQQLQAKKRRLDKQATEYYKRARTCLLGALPTSTQCYTCKMPLKIASAKCVSEGCDTQLCKSCAAKVEDNCSCVVCRRQPESTIRNIKCSNCEGGEFEYCHNDHGFICPDHTKEQECCVCGLGSFCTQGCGIGSCGRCGANLCSRCEYKEGCMCEGKSGRQLMMDSIGFGDY